MIFIFPRNYNIHSKFLGIIKWTQCQGHFKKSVDKFLKKMIIEILIISIIIFLWVYSSNKIFIIFTWR